MPLFLSLNSQPESRSPRTLRRNWFIAWFIIIIKLIQISKSSRSSDHQGRAAQCSGLEPRRLATHDSLESDSWHTCCRVSDELCLWIILPNFSPFDRILCIRSRGQRWQRFDNKTHIYIKVINIRLTLEKSSEEQVFGLRFHHKYVIGVSSPKIRRKLDPIYAFQLCFLEFFAEITIFLNFL